VLVLTSVASSASSYGDAGGDANTPADIVAVAVPDAASSVISVTVDVANYLALPANGSISLWFDVDASQGTGNAEGREARVRYDATGAIRLELWSGTRLVDRPATGIVGSFSSGRLSLSVPKDTLGIGAAFGLYVVSARGQPAGTGEFVAADSAPESGNFAFSGSEPLRFTDRADDHHSAPDITSVAVSDAEDGWISFAITMSNAAALPRAPVVGISIDADDDPETGDSGAEVGITALGGDVILDRWNERSRTWIPDLDDPRIRVASDTATVTIGVHRSELGAGSRLGFAALAAGITATRAFTGVDVTPDDARFFRYALLNGASVRLVAGKVLLRPARPTRGAKMVVSTPVTRSDTGAAVASAVVSCRVTVDAKRIVATGRYASGRASCTFGVPRKARRVVGSMTVRADGISSTVPFSFRVR
jgi:hypothetical protein